MTEKPHHSDPQHHEDVEDMDAPSLKVYAERYEARAKKLPKPNTIFLTLTEAAAVLQTTPYKVRVAIRKGHIRSKRVTKSPRAKFMIHREWLADYKRYQNTPSLTMRIKAWYRRTF